MSLKTELSRSPDEQIIQQPLNLLATGAPPLNALWLPNFSAGHNPDTTLALDVEVYGYTRGAPFHQNMENPRLGRHFCLAATSYCYTDTHCDDSGSATSTQILNHDGQKLWVLLEFEGKYDLIDDAKHASQQEWPKMTAEAVVLGCNDTL